MAVPVHEKYPAGSMVENVAITVFRTNQVILQFPHLGNILEQEKHLKPCFCRLGLRY